MSARLPLISFRRLVPISVVGSLISLSITATSAPLCRAIYYSEFAETVVKETVRPEVQRILESDPESIVSHLKGKVNVAEDAKFYRFIESVTAEILSTYQGQKIFFVARDGEWLYDAMRTILYQTAAGRSLIPQMHLLNLSRPLTQNTPAPALATYLKKNGIDIDAIIAGKQKVTLIDTGERGSIFIGALNKIIETHDLSGPNWKTKVSNLFNNFEVKLLHSSMKDNKDEILKNITSAKEYNKQTVQQQLYYLGFGTLGASSRAKVGIPTEHYSLHKWIVAEFERRMHWLGRATKVDSKGEASGFENVDRNPVAALYSQAQILLYFTQPSVLQGLQAPISKAVKQCGTPCAPATKQAEPAAISGSNLTQKALALKAGLKLKEGQIVKTPGGQLFEVLAYVDSGVRGSVYKARSLQTNEIVALKLAVNKDADTVKSFAEEKEKNKGYVLAGFPHAKLLEIGQDFMVKEFIVGTRADAWLASWIQAGMPEGTPQVQALSAMLKKAANEGIYVGDLNPKNLIWKDNEWVIVDSGTWRDDLSTTEILARYNEKVVGRWTKHQSSDVASQLRAQIGLE